MNDILDMNSVKDFVIVGGVVGVGTNIIFHILTGSVPGINGMIPWLLGGAVLGAMLFVFSSGITKPV